MNTDELFVGGHKLPPPLANEEVYRLIQEINDGSMDAREKLITHNIRLLLYEVTNKFKNVDYDKKDLVSIGSIGLLKAINTFDLTKGVEFSAYATKRINYEILMFLRKLKKNQIVDSIDRVVFKDKDGSEIKLGDRLYDSSDFIEDYEKTEIHKIIRELVKQLPNRDKEIIMLYFGFYDDKIYTQKEIGNKLHLSQVHISRLISKIIEKLRKQLERIDVIEKNTKSQKIRKDCTKQKIKKL